MKFLIAIVLYRIERKLTPLLKTNLSVFGNVFFYLNFLSSWDFFGLCSIRLVYLKWFCFLKDALWVLYIVLSVFWKCVTVNLDPDQWRVGFSLVLSNESFWRDLRSILVLFSEGLIKHPLLEGSLLLRTQLTTVVCRRWCDLSHRTWSPAMKEHN